jgi:putative ABC transport system permease protein
MGSTLARFAARDGRLATDGEPMYLVDLPPGADAQALWPALAEHGVALTPRAVWLHPDEYGPGEGATVDSLRAAALVALIVGLGLLEIVLLAGTAFAVGARRQTRELGLVAAAGGSARHVRRIVLAQGLVLGGLGAVTGVAVGAGLAVAARPFWERLEHSEFVVWTFGPREIAGAALVGLLSGVAAAIIPAIGAGRMRPVDALAERFRTTSAARRRGLTAGVVLLVAGVACGIAGDRLIADDFAVYARDLATPGAAYLNVPSPTGPIALIVGGATLLVGALVIVAPQAIGHLAAAGARLPLSLRLAVRDAARHRHRTGPATTAIAVAVAGSVVLAFLLAGQYRADELRYTPSLPPQVIAIDLDGDDVATAREAAGRAAAELPAGRADALRVPLGALPEGASDAGDRPELFPEPPPGAEDVAVGGIAIAGAPTLDATVAGRPLDAAARRALADGKTLVFDRRLVWSDGTLAIGDDQPDPVRVPAHVVERDVAYVELPSALMPAAVAREHGWDVRASRMFVHYAASATPDRVDAARGAAEQLGVSTFVEEGPDTLPDAALLGVAAIAAFVTLVGVAISVALSAAEGRADLATLAAVGAPPGRRRALAAGQAFVIAGLGCAVGIAFGAFVAFTARTTTGSPDFVVPWEHLAVTGIAVPLVAVLVAAVFTPSRLPLVRRAT